MRADDGWNRIALLVTGSLLVILLMPAASSASPASGATYKVAFQEVGLSGNVSWSVDLNGSVHTSFGTWVIFPAVGNGTYPFAVLINDTRFSPDPQHGNVTVAGAALYPTINFTEAMYPVSFAESGLPTGTSWSVSINGTKQASNTTQIVIEKRNGTYPFSINTQHMVYAPDPGNGYVTVQGGPIQETVEFRLYTYPVRFVRNDLENASVLLMVGKQNYTVPALGSVVVDLTNGTYPYTASTGIAGTSVPSGSFTVTGNGTTVSLVVSCGKDVGCQPLSRSNGSSAGALLTGSDLTLVLVAALAGSVLVIGGVLGWRSWNKSEDQREQDENPPKVSR